MRQNNSQKQNAETAERKAPRLACQRHIATNRSMIDAFLESVTSLEIPYPKGEQCQLCIIVMEDELRVALRSSMPSDEQASQILREYVFWFGLPVNVDKHTLLSALESDSLLDLIQILLNVGLVNQLMRIGCQPSSTEVLSIFRAIGDDAAAVCNNLAA